ncbi:B3 domain-containing transcription factor VRN1 [Citrus sinensis]|nr:B3 domain-containing transcription factor VRN1 [Citrus sinensis]
MKKTYPHFIDVILDSTIEDKKMIHSHLTLFAKMQKIPQNFVGRFGDELSNVATLTNPEGYVMRVGITRKDGKIWFDDGWNDFVENHSIDVGYFVLFQYRKNSKFRVFIYNTTTCEIQYPSRNTFPPPRQNQATFDSSKSKNGCEMRGKTYRMEEVKVKEESDNVNDSMQDVIGTCNSEGSVHAKIHLSETQCSSVQESDLKIDSTKFKKAKHNLKDELRADSVDQVKLFALLEDMDIHICESRMTLEERQEAINVARLLKPEKPSFLVFMRASNMQLNYVYVPTSFARKYLNGEECVTVQDSDGRKLAVKVKQSRRKYLLTRWGKFFKKANVKEGDILFFEMIQMKKILLKVSVFHA